MNIIKKIALMSIAILAVQITSAQTNINLKLNHLLSGNAFAFGVATQNDISHDFSLDRFEYYISGISIIHDGGTVTPATEVYLHVKANDNGSYSLGSFSGITTVEGINFSIGVDSKYNTADPSQWPSSHALSPKSPSMHWGWAAGYRFVALEGRSGSNLNLKFQVHALGNQNYFKISIPTAATANNGELDITLNADYANTVSSLSIDQGLTIHGDYDEAVVLLRNFRDKVFTSTSGEGNTTSVEGVTVPDAFTIFPNPAVDEVTIALDDIRFMNASITVSTILGTTVYESDIEGVDNAISINESGMYVATLRTKEGLVSTRKFIVL